jgi:hypothetical protein
MRYYFFVRSTLSILMVLTIVLLSGCSPTSPSSQITRDRAIDLARQTVRFEPTNITATLDTVRGHPVWVVTLTRGDRSHGLFEEFAEISVDRKTGEIVRLAIS